MSKHNSHFFSPEEVNALIPQLEEHFQNFWALRQNAQTILEELRQQAKRWESRAADEIAGRQIRQSQALFLLERGKKELELIMELGGIVKDLEIGLVDFPYLLESEDEEVHLCWKFGEKKIRFWHGVNEGFTSRKPLSRRVHS